MNYASMPIESWVWRVSAGAGAMGIRNKEVSLPITDSLTQNVPIDSQSTVPILRAYRPIVEPKKIPGISVEAKLLHHRNHISG
ncbi:MAG: hypothetical protein VB877_08090, partial [Pirellulaceae bacterium]